MIKAEETKNRQTEFFLNKAIKYDFQIIEKLIERAIAYGQREIISHEMPYKFAQLVEMELKKAGYRCEFHSRNLNSYYLEISW